MSKFGSIVLGVAAGTVASIGILFALDKDKTLCKKNSDRMIQKITFNLFIL